MKFVVVSDNHGLVDLLNSIRIKHQDADAFIHCGDSEMTEYQLSGWASVEGNNDYYADLPLSRILNINGFKVFVTHSHKFSYFNRNERMVEKALKEGCQLICFGHTHVFFDEVVDGVRLLNPGSLRYNRDGSKPCYAVVSVDDDNYSKISIERIVV